MLKSKLFLFFLLAPIVSLFFISLEFGKLNEALVVPSEKCEGLVAQAEKEMPEEISTVVLNDEINQLFTLTEELKAQIDHIRERSVEERAVYDNKVIEIQELTTFSETLRVVAEGIYEKKILSLLGEVVGEYISDSVEIKVFELLESGYRGFIAKVKLLDPEALKVVIAGDAIGKLETPSAMTERVGGILAINGGGFFVRSHESGYYAQMIGNTIVDGGFVEPFRKEEESLFFAGINSVGEVIGVIPKKQQDILDLDPYQGVSFIPVLLQSKTKLYIPIMWRAEKHPRTVLGRYANEDLVMVVVDGRQGSWSRGVTLETLRDKLLYLGIVDAYNLDGGGSSTMYFDGKILNRPSDGYERPVVNSIVIMH